MHKMYRTGWLESDANGCVMVVSVALPKVELPKSVNLHLITCTGLSGFDSILVLGLPSGKHAGLSERKDDGKFVQ